MTRYREDQLEVNKKVREFRNSVLFDKTMSKIFREKVTEYAELIQEEKKLKNEYANKYIETSEPWLSLALQVQGLRIEVLEREQKRFQKYAGICGKQMDTTFEEQVERARSFPIADVFEQTGREYGGRIKLKCPFHNEDTASFILFTKENNYHCFGCSAHGDVISLYMKLHGVTFLSAIKTLSQTLG